MRKIWRWHWSLRKAGLSLEDVFGKFEVLRICFGKEDMDIGRKKEKRKTIIGD